MSSPCLRKIFSASFATCSSTGIRKSGSASIITTSAPRRAHTLPSSRPMTPAPTTPSRCGTSVNSSAPVESTISSPNGAGGISIGTEPVARITLPASMISASPSCGVNSTLRPASNLPLPARSGDAVGLEQARDAAGQLADDMTLAFQHHADIHRQIPGADAVHRETVLRIVELVRTVEQRLRGNAAHVQTGATEDRLCRRHRATSRSPPSSARAARSGSPPRNRRGRRRSPPRRIAVPCRADSVAELGCRHECRPT